jgi:hypothetical protein
MTRSRLVVGLFSSLALGAGGCAAVPVAAVGTLAGAGASAVSTGNDIVRLGKVETAEMASFDETVSAARQAGADLALRAKPDEQRDHGVLRLHFADDPGDGIKVDVQARTARLVRLRVDVGWFGSQQTARLLLARLRAHLPRVQPAGTMPADDRTGAGL